MKEPTKEFTITVHMIQGDPIRFKIKRTLAEMRNMATNLESVLQARYFGVHLNGKLVIVPFHNVRSVEIDPALSGLVTHILRDAEPVDE
jgi:hypothetical protein